MKGVLNGEQKKDYAAHGGNSHNFYGMFVDAWYVFGPIW